VVDVQLHGPPAITGPASAACTLRHAVVRRCLVIAGWPVRLYGPTTCCEPRNRATRLLPARYRPYRRSANRSIGTHHLRRLARRQRDAEPRRSCSSRGTALAAHLPHPPASRQGGLVSCAAFFFPLAVLAVMIRRASAMNIPGAYAPRRPDQQLRIRDRECCSRFATRGFIRTNAHGLEAVPGGR